MNNCPSPQEFADMWVIYENPRDYPWVFLARRWLYNMGPNPFPTEDIATAPTLDEVRAAVSPNRVRFQRADTDDPCIVETWI